MSVAIARATAAGRRIAYREKTSVHACVMRMVGSSHHFSFK
jgi:hypothetical protein